MVLGTRPLIDGSWSEAKNMVTVGIEVAVVAAGPIAAVVVDVTGLMGPIPLSWSTSDVVCSNTWLAMNIS